MRESDRNKCDTSIKVALVSIEDPLVLENSPGDDHGSNSASGNTLEGKQKKKLKKRYYDKLWSRAESAQLQIILG